MSNCADGADYAVFSAAVADYQPESSNEGKIPSGQRDLSVRLHTTVKVIETVMEPYPQTGVVSFKYEADADPGALLEIGRNKIESGHELVVLNGGANTRSMREHTAMILNSALEIRECVSKAEIARGLVDEMARSVAGPINAESSPSCEPCPTGQAKPTHSLGESPRSPLSCRL